MQHPKLLALPLVLALASCVTTSVTRLSTTVRPETQPEDVRIYLSMNDVQGRYEKVGIIYARGDSWSTDQEMMFNKARKDAAKLGANGLVMNTIDEAPQGAKVAAAFLGGSTQRHGELVAIYVFPSVRAAPAEESGAAAQDDARAPSGEARPGDEGPSFEEWLAAQEAEGAAARD